MSTYKLDYMKRVYCVARYPNTSTLIGRFAHRIQVTFQFLVPPEEMFYVPWSHAWLSQFLLKAKNRDVTQTVRMTSQVILTPSPGEQFQLNLRAFDQFLRSLNASVAFLSVRVTHRPYDAHLQSLLLCLRVADASTGRIRRVSLDGVVASR